MIKMCQFRRFVLDSLNVLSFYWASLSKKFHISVDLNDTVRAYSKIIVSHIKRTESQSKESTRKLCKYPMQTVNNAINMKM